MTAPIYSFAGDYNASQTTREVAERIKEMGYEGRMNKRDRLSAHDDNFEELQGQGREDCHQEKGKDEEFL